MEEVIKTYKGMSKDMSCRGFQFEQGKEYEVEGEIKACKNGFHACKMPLDVFGYYNPAESRYFEVEQSGDLDEDTDDSKVASRKIKIGAEIGIAGLVKAHVEYIREKTEYKGKNESGDRAQIGSSGNRAQIGSSGDWAQIGSSGNRAQIGSSGDRAQIGSSGNRAEIDSTGENSVIMCAGNNCNVKGKNGTWITLAEYDDNGICICCKSAKIDGETLKPDTWYTLKGGEFVEAE